MQNTGVDEHGRSRRGIRAEFIREDALVGELEYWGVRYLTRRTMNPAIVIRSPELLLSDLVRQPSSRVRNAVIALLLLHPEFASHVPMAIKRLRGQNRWLLKFFYTAAVILQDRYRDQLQPFLTGQALCAWKDLPDLFGSEIIPGAQGSPEERLIKLGQEQQFRLGQFANWPGTYDNAARHLIRQLELEARWNQ